MRITSKAAWTRRLVRENIYNDLLLVQQSVSSCDSNARSIDFSELKSPLDLPQRPQQSGYRANVAGDDPIRICIIGAGLTGLFAAMLLEELNVPNLSYDILEASDRVGGRLMTYRFSKDEGKSDYFDVGAMRYPGIPLMKRVFRLFEVTNTSLLPYALEGRGCPMLFNNVVTSFEESSAQDLFKYGRSRGGLVPDDLVYKGPDSVISEAYGPYITAMSKDFEKGFSLLMTQDTCSTRSYLLRELGLDFHSVQWLETRTTAAGLFDQAFSESVFDYLDFAYPVEEVQWYSIDGGSARLTENMLKRIKTRPQTRAKVTAIKLDRSRTEEICIEVRVAGEATDRTYDTVISTTTLGALNRIDLQELELHPVQRAAISTLHYDSSVKVAVKFTHQWWGLRCGIVNGGTAKTDRPLRTCVYPIYQSNEDTGVLLCSYTWSQDARRMGSLVSSSSPDGEFDLIQLILDDLAALHSDYIGREELAAAYVDHYAYDWDRDIHASGAFALFGPGQFSNFYPYLIRPAADARFHIAGEAASAHHAWLAGSLESACRSVLLVLERFGYVDKAAELRASWGGSEELELGTWGTAHLLVELGRGV